METKQDPIHGAPAARRGDADADDADDDAGGGAAAGRRQNDAGRQVAAHRRLSAQVAHRRRPHQNGKRARLLFCFVFAVKQSYKFQNPPLGALPTRPNRKTRSRWV